MARRRIKFYQGEYYHLYNRGHNREQIFFEPMNYVFFLRQVRKYLIPVTQIMAYCLMPSHYHFLVKVKRKKTSEVSETSEVLDLSMAVMRLIVSYTKSINAHYDRVGTLFQGAFQAKHVKDENYLVSLSAYIHLNPVRAGLVKRPEYWEFSSYQEYIGRRNGTLPETEMIMSQFSSMRGYQKFVEAASADGMELNGDCLLE
jgi:REP element-mobilizing transposase RayT